MKIKLVEASGKSFDSIQSKVERALSGLKDLGIEFNFYKTLKRNKYLVFYYGTFRGVPLTLSISTTNIGIDDVGLDIFLTLEIEGVVTKLGSANSSNSESIRELFTIYLDDIDRRKSLEEDRTKKQEEQRVVLKKQRDAEAKLKQEEFAQKIKDKELVDRSILNQEYKELTGKDLLSDLTNEEASQELLKEQFFIDFSNAISLLNKEGQLLQLSLKGKEDSELIKVKRLAYNQYLLDDEVYSQDKIEKHILDKIQNDGLLPTLLSVYNRKDLSIFDKIYR